MSADTTAPDDSLTIVQDDDVWRLSGALTIRTATRASQDLGDLGTQSVRLDLNGLTRFDTAGAWVLLQLRNRLKDVGNTLDFVDLTDDQKSLIDRVEHAVPKMPEASARPNPFRMMLEAVGRATVGAGQSVTGMLGMLGLFIAKLLFLLRHPAQFRTTALFYHADQVGWRAIPIVSLMAFLIGVVLAFQGAVQLRQFGAEIFVVDLIAISILRELGILLTAIIVAGRTASSFTASIGSMKMREEIDAMNTLAIDPATVLFVPRILALLITLPILGLVANVAGLIGGALMSWIELGISPAMFLTRLLQDTSMDHVIVGFVKAPVFAIIIGVIGCYCGMQVKGNAESLGKQTSSAVVQAIFAVIVADAMFSVFFAMMGI